MCSKDCQYLHFTDERSEAQGHLKASVKRIDFSAFFNMQSTLCHKHCSYLHFTDKGAETEA